MRIRAWTRRTTSNARRPRSILSDSFPPCTNNSDRQPWLALFDRRRPETAAAVAYAIDDPSYVPDCSRCCTGDRVADSLRGDPRARPFKGSRRA